MATDGGKSPEDTHDERRETPAWITSDLLVLTQSLTGMTRQQAIDLIVALQQLNNVVQADGV